MICLTVSLRGLPIWTVPEAQALLEEYYCPKGRKAATGAAETIWQPGGIITLRMKAAVRSTRTFSFSALMPGSGRC